MKNIKLHLIAFGIVIIAELIGKHSFNIGIGTIVLLPMLFSLVIGVLTTPKFLNIAKQKEMDDAGKLITVTLMLLMAKYGTTIGPTISTIIKSSPALILQEFGNLGTVLLGVPLGILLGLKREVIGGAHSISREPNVALIAERYGLDSKEGEGVLGVYIIGTVFGTIFMGVIASLMASAKLFHPYSLAMASGVGSASMMTASVGALVALFPEMTNEITAFGAASNLLSGLDGIYMSIFLALPLSEKLYKIFYKLKYKTAPEEAATEKSKEENNEV
ncbi:DUF3100 domain-containing protein [Treponema phagedenis]|uniref:DUF3100 domain-containing protein n=1 Tax=Treponema phagedenis TaxID=162 RepID=A0A0B7GQI6_TREPH|nr:DUF3100 domain-containing protein [Treponema phagedenis]EFW38120.1 hypothetical protein HMPREF9554_01369 [Treponema phagedenis F0421]NVP24525.1 DUF3100 domain-containing protein [Treponema phagedenis]QEJ94780.1 DUF3100 domain-containing protein [Treponema phagedenis]QEJ97716.1 DUF3100 domain-containing protein [Treponema phagedenis]QEK00686.1 DUF3100 domain-containing protein [Treponema phagedenis]